MNWLLLLGIITIFQDDGTKACLPRLTKELTDSYVPVGIQALNHYTSQLQMYYPYAFTPFCQTGKQTTGILASGICVAESVARINLLLIDLQREAAKRNLEDSQGLTFSVLSDIKKTSQMTAAQQFRFILEKLQEEEIGSKITQYKIADFLRDLKNPNSKLFRNLHQVKPLKYLV